MPVSNINPVDQHVGRRLRKAREQRGLTQTQLAASGGVSFQQVQKYELGKNRVSASMMWDFCGVLRVSPNFFFEGLQHDN